jgi:hypothetical protein
VDTVDPGDSMDRMAATMDPAAVMDTMELAAVMDTMETGPLEATAMDTMEPQVAMDMEMEPAAATE